MKTLRRTGTRAPAGRYSREVVRNAVNAVHVLEAGTSGKWEVRTLGERGATKLFDGKEAALAHAFSIKKGAKVVLHQRHPKKVLVARPLKRHGRIVLKEVKHAARDRQ